MSTKTDAIEELYQDVARNRREVRDAMRMLRVARAKNPATPTWDPNLNLKRKLMTWMTEYRRAWRAYLRIITPPKRNLPVLPRFSDISGEELI